MELPMSDIRFPGESAEYRVARDRLLSAEIDLRRTIEAVAAQRRALPLGGKVSEDYVFETMRDEPVRMSELFHAGKHTLVVYSYMYSPAMKTPCSSCTSIIDSLDGAAQHVEQRVNLAVVAKSPPARIRDVARERGWDHVQLLSSANNSYNIDYHAEGDTGGQMPVLNVFVRRDDGIYHTYATELIWAPRDEGQDPRHADSIWPLWNVFDYTPDGRGTTGIPKLKY
jgi:predicted dithiol-disulfide oxidoreductase (DUF899 family)